MKNIGKLAVLGAVLAVSSSFALADTVVLGSFAGSAIGSATNTATVFGGSGNPGGYSTSVFNTNPILDAVDGGVASFNIGTGGVWAGPLANSSWVSNNVNSAPGGSFIAPNGYYDYSTSFTAAGGSYTGSLTLLADDTVAVYLNGVLVLQAGVVGADSKCSVNPPTCTVTDTIAFNPTLLVGTNHMEFVVEQTGLASEGLDFDGSITQNIVNPTVPEPSSLMMLGTGLVSAAGMLFRRRRQTV